MEMLKLYRTVAWTPPNNGFSACTTAVSGGWRACCDLKLYCCEGWRLQNLLHMNFLNMIHTLTHSCSLSLTHTHTGRGANVPIFVKNKLSMSGFRVTLLVSCAQQKAGEHRLTWETEGVSISISSNISSTPAPPPPFFLMPFVTFEKRITKRQYQAQTQAPKLRLTKAIRKTLLIWQSHIYRLSITN